MVGGQVSTWAACAVGGRAAGRPEDRAAWRQIGWVADVRGDRRAQVVDFVDREVRRRTSPPPRRGARVGVEELREARRELGRGSGGWDRMNPRWVVGGLPALVGGGSLAGGRR